MERVPSCEEHEALVQRAMDPDAPDDVLERYAETVPGCDACRRALARDLQVHPVVLDGTGEPSVLLSDDALDELQAALTAPASGTSRGAEPTVGRPLLIGVGLAAAAAAAWLLATGPVDGSEAPAPPTAAQPAPSLPPPPSAPPGSLTQHQPERMELLKKLALTIRLLHQLLHKLSQFFFLGVVSRVVDKVVCFAGVFCDIV